MGKNTSKESSKTMSSLASKVLKSNSYSKNAKKLAGSVLSQSKKKK